ncbi:phosphatidylglycerophosphatase A family protein [Ferruginibacter profundus]
MRIIYKSIATVCGIGYVDKGAGSVAAVAYCTILFFLAAYDLVWQPVALVIILITGIWSAGALEKIWGHDSNKVVIDEVAGMMITLLFIPVTSTYLSIGFILFRFFDIVKPLGIKKAEQLPGGWGVMADDVVAGIYAHLLLRLVIASNIF